MNELHLMRPLQVNLPYEPHKFRYSKDDIEFLQNLRWWDKGISWIRENSELLCNIEKLKKKEKNYEKKEISKNFCM